MDNREEQLEVIALKLGLSESEDMAGLRRWIVLSAKSPETKDRYNSLLMQYAEMGENIISSIPNDGTDSYINGQVAMNVLRLRLAYACGSTDERTGDWYYDLLDQLDGLQMLELKNEIQALFAE